MPGKEAWMKGKELALKAVALHPSLADAHLSLGIAMVNMFDWQEGEKEIKRAIELNPSLTLAHDQYGWLLSVLGRFEEAIAQQQKACELDPLSALLNVDLGWYLFWAGRYDEAIAQFRKTLELDGNYANAYHWLAWGHLLKGEKEAAIAEFQKAASLDDLTWYKGSLGYAYGLTGNRAKAEQSLRELEALAQRQYVDPGAFISVYLGLDRKDKALDWLEKCYENQDPFAWYLKIHPLYDSVRTEPRFQALVKKAFPDP